MRISDWSSDVSSSDLAFAIMAHRCHKEFLADREGRGQRVEECGAAGIAAVPPARRRHVATEFEVALFDPYVVGGAEGRGHRAAFLRLKLQDRKSTRLNSSH